MKLQNLLLIISFVSIGSVNVFGQADFFWSTVDLNDGALNGDLVTKYESGETGSLYLYYSTNGPADSDLSVGAFLDVATSESGIIEFTRAKTFDFVINVAGTPIANRWLGPGGGGGSVGETGTVTSDLIDEWHAFTVTGGLGILEANNAGAWGDSGYDEDADAFLFGVIDFTVIGQPGSSVDLMTSAGDGLIVNGDEVVDAVFGSATINVAGIPEPTAAGLLALGLTAIACRRRK